ncbi:sigma-54 dependent transcriptional regulator [Desulfococcaceae bacterium HSG8]|nr:sigma-54 dependent transcriptional regulator [Desulfococcaceae bacterium HSG8]
MAKILIVDDSETFCVKISMFIRREGYECERAGNLRDGIRMADETDYDIVLLDVVLPDGNGLEHIGKFGGTRSSPEVIIITGQEDAVIPEAAVKNGAWYYIQKPVTLQNLRLLLKRALEYRENRLRLSEQGLLNRGLIIGDSPKIRACLEAVARVSNSEGNVLITGETGTGKELFANAVHMNSRRAEKAIVPVDCTSIPENLGEGLLFGHKKGTFTGADQDREGLIRQAEGSTLFLDEVADLPMPVQKSLLRVLQDKKFRPLGAKKEVTCDFRVVSATNRDMERMVEKGTFRKDLYYRLVTSRIHLPPLRERTEDIMPLAVRYIKTVCTELDTDVKDISEEFGDFLNGYQWPGNVRELNSVIRETISGAVNEQVLCPHHLPSKLRIHFFKSGLDSCTSSVQNLPLDNKRDVSSDPGELPKFKEYREQVIRAAESDYLDRLIKAADGKVEAACRLSGLSQARLYQLLKKHKKKLKVKTDKKPPNK